MVEDPAFDFASHNVRAARNETQALKEFNIPPILLVNASRAAMTMSRRDCDLIPKMGESHFLRRQARWILHDGKAIFRVLRDKRQVVCSRIMMERRRRANLTDIDGAQDRRHKAAKHGRMRQRPAQYLSTYSPGSASSSSRRMVDVRAFVLEINNARAERNKSNLAAERREF
jgi:hypothetical protein